MGAQTRLCCSRAEQGDGGAGSWLCKEAAGTQLRPQRGPELLLPSPLLRARTRSGPESWRKSHRRHPPRQLPCPLLCAGTGQSRGRPVSAGTSHLATRQRIGTHSKHPLGITPCPRRDLPHPPAGPRGSAGPAGARQGQPRAPGLRPRPPGFPVAVLGPPSRGADGAKTLLPLSAGGHSPGGSHHRDGVTCTLLSPPAQRRARRQAGKRTEDRPPSQRQDEPPLLLPWVPNPGTSCLHSPPPPNPTL